MKTALRSVALCLLISNSRGFAFDQAEAGKLLCELAALGAKGLVAAVIALRTVEAVQAVSDKAGDCNTTLHTILDYTVNPVLKFADVRKPIFGSNK